MMVSGEGCVMVGGEGCGGVVVRREGNNRLVARGMDVTVVIVRL